MVRNFRKPLVVAAPKTLLRSPVATSDLSQMAPGTSFQPVLGDTHAVNKHVTRVVFVSGKHYYTLQAYREQQNIQNTAIIRVEVGTDSPHTSQNVLIKMVCFHGHYDIFIIHMHYMSKKSVRLFLSSSPTCVKCYLLENLND